MEENMDDVSCPPRKAWRLRTLRPTSCCSRLLCNCSIRIGGMGTVPANHSMPLWENGKRGALASRRRNTPSSCDSATMFSPLFSRTTAIWLNAFGYRPTRLLAVRSLPLTVPSVLIPNCLNRGVHPTVLC